MKSELCPVFEQFCSEKRILANLSPRTIEWYRRCFKTFFTRMPHVKDLDDFNTENIRVFLYNGRLNHDWKVDTFRNYFGAFRGFLSWCVKRKYISENPVLEIEKPRVEKSLPKSISLEEAELILDHAFHQKTPYRFDRYRNRAVFALMLFSGLRTREMLDLKYQDIDFINNIICVRMGKGAKDRVIPICSRLKVYLSEYLIERARLKRTIPNFITSGNGDKPFTYSGLKKVSDRLRKSAKVQFTNHGLRHTFATLMVQGGCNIYALSQMMGHKDIKTTTIYLSATALHLQGQIVKHPMNY